MARRKRIAFLVNDVFSAYQWTFRAAIERSTARRGCDLFVFMGRELEHAEPNERAQNAIYGWVSPDVVDGALILSGTMANFTGEQGIAALALRLAPIPVVSIGLAIPGVPSVTLNNRRALAVAVEHLARQHLRRRVAYIGGPTHNAEAQARLAGYRDATTNEKLGFDERLVTVGRFNLQSGQECMRELVARGVDLDAVIAANDEMAMGAMDVLRERGLRVPEDVVVVGFDNTPVARYAARSLTTVAQPIDEMAEAGVQALLGAMEGDPTPPRLSFDAQLVLRESCGCSYATVRSPHSLNPPKMSVTDFLQQRRELFIRETSPTGAATGALWRADWAPRLLDALASELSGQAGAFSLVLERMTEEALAQRTPLEEISYFIVRLQRQFDAEGYHGAAQFELEQLWMKARTLVSSATSRHEARAALDQIEGSVNLRYATQRLSIAFESRSLAAELERSLPMLGVDTAYVALQPTDDPHNFRPLVAFERGQPSNVSRQPHPTRTLLPDGFGEATEGTLLVWAVTFEHEVLGLLVFGGKADPLVGEAIRAQIGAAVKMGELHARVVEQTAFQERLAREELMHEMSLAKRIQTALAPKDLAAESLDIAATMLPADVVGGDYYDVLPVRGGCWLGIGDVAGHGLMSGLVMLMIQSIVSTLVTSRPDASPAELVIDVNRVLAPNLHKRLQRNEHATLALLRVFEDGLVRFAGAHEDLILWRVATRRCTPVGTDGTWLGLVEDITSVTNNHELRLEVGDLLVLFTDGLVEARNARAEHFGADAVCRIVETNADSSPDRILAEVMAAMRAWAPVQQDDVTCVVARYTGSSPSAGQV